jgi:hypothetical protein
VVDCPFLQPGLGLAVADHDDVCRRLEPGCGVEKELETPALGQLADGSDDGSPGRYSETISPNRPIGRFEPVVESHRQHGCRHAVHGALKIALKAGVGEQGGRQPPIEVAVVRIVSDVAGAAERTDQQAAVVNPGGDAQEVVMGEMADDDVGFRGQRIHRPEIRTKVGEPSFLHQPGHSPVMSGETPLEVASADEKHPRVYSSAVQGTTAELGHGTRAGPLVGENDHARSHEQTLSPFSFSCPPTSDVVGQKNEIFKGRLGKVQPNG